MLVGVQRVQVMHAERVFAAPGTGVLVLVRVALGVVSGRPRFADF